jgi:hypothetical protein
MPYNDPEKQKQFQAKHYLENRGKYSESSKKARDKRKAKLNELKSGPCTDCKACYPPECMDFDHTEDNKVMSVSKMICKTSWQEVLDEIAKCELVCANCHRIRTTARLKA